MPDLNTARQDCFDRLDALQTELKSIVKHEQRDKTGRLQYQAIYKILGKAIVDIDKASRNNPKHSWQ